MRPLFDPTHFYWFPLRPEVPLLPPDIISAWYHLNVNAILLVLLGVFWVDGFLFVLERNVLELREFCFQKWWHWLGVISLFTIGYLTSRFLCHYIFSTWFFLRIGIYIIHLSGFLTFFLPVYLSVSTLGTAWETERTRQVGEGKKDFGNEPVFL